MQIVIPCGGLATRLGSLAKNTPKAMLKIDNRPFLEFQLDVIKKALIFDEVILCIGHLGNKIKHHFRDEYNGLAIHYSKDNQLGVMGAIKNASDLLDSQFFMMYGDSYLPRFNFDDMYFKYLNQKRMVMMAVWRNENELAKSNIKSSIQKVVGVGSIDAEHIDYGIILFEKKALEYIPKKKFFSTEQMWKLLTKKDELAAYHIDQRFYEIGTPNGLEELRIFLKD